MVARYAYRPISYTEIEEQMDILFKTFRESGDEIKDALEIHNRIMEIYPFSANNESLARICAYYILMKKGYPLFVPGFSTGEYCNFIQEYLHSGRSEKFYSALQRSIYNRLDFLLGFTNSQE